MVDEVFDAGTDTWTEAEMTYLLGRGGFMTAVKNGGYGLPLKGLYVMVRLSKTTCLSTDLADSPLETISAYKGINHGHGHLLWSDSFGYRF